MNTEALTSQQKAAHIVWVELTTRIATRRLPFRSGDEESAASSIYELFKTTRKLMTENPEATGFLALAKKMLNKTLSPYTARWHRWMSSPTAELDKDGKPVPKFSDEWERKQFRRELRALQPHLVGYALAFGAMKDRRVGKGWWTAAEKSPDELKELREHCLEPKEAILGKTLTAGITASPVQFKGTTKAEEIDRKERKVILRKRGSASDGPVENACGLAFSGGGIRSATFCLGISQVLARRGLFQEFDYLSTVSGGGYFGSFLSATLGTGEPVAQSGQDETAARLKVVFDAPIPTVGAVATQPHKPANPLESVPDQPQPVPPSAPKQPHETIPIHHLRNHSRYLAEGGFRQQVSGVGMVLAGVFFNLLILMLVPLSLVLLTVALDALGIFHMCEWATDPDYLLPLHDGWGISVLFILALTALAGLAYPCIKSGSEWAIRRDPETRMLKSWEKVFFLAASVSAVVVLVSLLPIGFRIYDFILSDDFLPSLNDLKVKLDGLAAAFGLSLTVVLTALASKLNPKGTFGGWFRKLAIVSPPAFCLFIYFAVGHRILIATGADQWPGHYVFLVALAIFLWAFVLVDVNTYSPHGYYRDRLSDCYLRIMQPASSTTAASPAASPNITMLSADRLQLSKLNQHAAAPYHLINATLNIPNSKERDVRGRNADFFLFSKYHCGSPLTGYYPTKVLEAADPHLDLGTAMAISGAAASSNMGWQTDNLLRMAMTLGNVRLGYWLRNPAQTARGAWKWSSPTFPYLLREMFALKMDETQPYFNLSDGGHHENLAVYELLRRRCKFIVCIDGGCEPDMQCADLLRLERYAAIDLGIKMHYDLTDLYLQPNGYSRAYGVLVKIDYDPPKTETERRNREPEDAEWGWMLYLKLAMVGYGPGYVMDYKRTHAAFPHETTNDQIYEEEQFEAYRALGEAAAESFFVSEITEAANTTTVTGWFKALANTLLPDNDEAMVNRGRAS